MKRVIGADTETFDPLLKTRGYSWKYGEGYILCTSLYFEKEDLLQVIAGKHNSNSPFSEAQRRIDNLEIKQILQDPNVMLVGANIAYDLGWWLYEYGMSAYDVKCSLVDILIAERFIDEFSKPDLENTSRKYLNYGKTKDRVEAWVRDNVAKRGDFRKYLKDAPYELVDEYVRGDSKNPVKIWRKQLTILKEQGLCERVKLEFDCILPALQMTMYGLPIDEDKKRENYAYLSEVIKKFRSEFIAKYNLPNFRVTATRDVASFLDAHNIPYNHTITLKGYKGKVFSNGDETDEAYHKAKQIVSQFRLVKGKPVAYVPKEMAERTQSLLEEEGFMCNNSPHLDKKYRESKREGYPEVALIDDWKKANDICSKILGDAYNRFYAKNFKGETCVKPQIKTADTKTHRMSENNPNGQQIPSKNGIKVHDEYGREVDISFPKITRALFRASKGCVFGKIDYGQIEYRLICNIACGESGEEVRRQYAKNPHLDFHQYVVDLTGLSRKYAKNMSFGISFGMGLPSMAENFGWTMEHAEEIAEAYHSKMPFVAPTLALVGDVAKTRGYIKTAYGAHARLPDKRKAYSMLNRYTQEGGAECMKCAIRQSWKEGVFERLKTSNVVHDELNFPYLEPTEEQMIDLYRMAEIMRTAMPNLRVPLEAEIELGDNWANTKEIKDWVEIREKDKENWEKTSPELKQAVSICEKLIKEGRVQSA